ncbi:MAG: hypothetical protein GY827_10660, partial [Cytophagales bacterium]|nr:hypothetical protein [Cytophagales bacterium]
MILRKILVFVLGLISLTLTQTTYAQNEQCTEVPVEEAVRNGDFEKGYVNGAGTKYLNGGNVDFSHGFTWPYAYSGNNTPCIWGAANQAGVARNQRHKCGVGPYIGFKYYGNAKFKDHTPGKNGNGFALILDMVGKQTKTAWKQTTNIYANQNYYFSAWFAKYTAGNWVGKLRFYAKGNNTGTRELVASANVNGGLLQWKQFNGVWDSRNNTSVTLEIVFVGSGNPNSDDFVIDDISFINGCQNIQSLTSYGVEFAKEEVSLCYNNGSYTAQVKKNDGTNLGSGGKGITWFKGAGNTQTEVTAFENQDSPNITQPGTYRACIIDSKNGGCTVNSTIVVTEDLDVTLPNTVELCDPAQVTIDTKREENGLVHTWTVPNGATASSNNKQVVNVGGNYKVDLSLASNVNCQASATTNAISNLPTVPTNLTYCEGGGEKTVLKHQNKNWKWCEDGNCQNVIGKGTAVDYTVPNGTSGDQIVYMQSAVTSNAGTVGPNVTSSYPTGAGAATNFTAYQAIQLASVQVQSVAWGGSCNGGGKRPNVTVSIPQLGLSKVVKLNCGANATLNLGFDIPKGGPYTLRITSGKALNFGPTSRREINDVILLAGGNTVFKNWVIKKSEACAPVAVTLKGKSCCNKPADVTINEGATAELCTGDNITLTTNAQANKADYVYGWYKGTYPGGTLVSNGGASATGVNKLDHTVNHGEGTDTYTIVVADKTNALNPSCQSTATISITDLNAPTASDAGSAEIICADNTTLSANTVATGETGEWTVVSGSGTFTDANDPTTTVTGIGTGDNVYKWTITNSCGSDDSDVTITRRTPILAGTLSAASGTATTICANTDSHNFEVTGASGDGLSYSWSIANSEVNINGNGATVELIVGDVTAGSTDKLVVEVSGDCPGT